MKYYRRITIVPKSEVSASSYSFIITRWRMTAIKSLNTKLLDQYVLHVNFDVWLNPVLAPMCR